METGTGVPGALPGVSETSVTVVYSVLVVWIVVVISGSSVQEVEGSTLYYEQSWRNGSMADQNLHRISQDTNDCNLG